MIGTLPKVGGARIEKGRDLLDLRNFVGGAKMINVPSLTALP